MLKISNGWPAKGLLSLLLLGLPLAGCLDLPMFSSGGGARQSGGTAALLNTPGVEDGLQRLRAEFETLRPSHKAVRSDDPYVSLFAEVLGRVVHDHVRSVEPTALIDGAIKGLRKGIETEKQGPPTDRLLMEAAIMGMMSGLDPYSSYLNPEAYRNMQAQTHGEFGGLGLEVTLDQKTGFVRVVAPIDGTPAAEAGLRSGDLISDVDGAPVKGMTLIQAVFRMRGPTGTSVRLTLLRSDNGSIQVVTLIRSIVKLHPIQSRLEGDVGYVRITTFNERTASELEDAVAKIKLELGPRLAGLVLDLRNDPGGLLDQAISVADDFIDSGQIVSVRGRRQAEGRSYEASGGNLVPGLPVVVLINSGSASASEIVAAALQDHQRALVFGTRSYGKGSVQTVSPLPDGGALRLTTARYYRPAGTSVDCVGVTPDLEIRSPQSAGRSEDMHQDPGTCNGTTLPAALPSPLRMADICPTVEDAKPVPLPASPTVESKTDEEQKPAPRDGKDGKDGKNVKAGPDVPLRCAVSAISSRRIVSRH
ncbi:MAG: S41 family peptidase [Rhodospirillaceae bacterium]